MPKSPEPDEFGRLRVRDKDTGHVRSIPNHELPHGNYEVLKAAASDLNGDPLPVVHAAAPESPVEPVTTSGQSADPKKEQVHD